jgi:hypothetical protein
MWGETPRRFMPMEVSQYGQWNSPALVQPRNSERNCDKTLSQAVFVMADDLFTFEGRQSQGLEFSNKVQEVVVVAVHLEDMHGGLGAAGQRFSVVHF